MKARQKSSNSQKSIQSIHKDVINYNEKEATKYIIFDYNLELFLTSKIKNTDSFNPILFLFQWFTVCVTKFPHLVILGSEPCLAILVSSVYYSKENEIVTIEEMETFTLKDDNGQKKGCINFRLNSLIYKEKQT